MAVKLPDWLLLRGSPTSDVRRPRALARIADFASMLRDRARATRADPPRRARFERFGAIVQLTVPRALVFVDRAMARRTVAMRGEPQAWRAPESRARRARAVARRSRRTCSSPTAATRAARAATPARRPAARRTSGASPSGSARSTRSPTPACSTSRSAAARARSCRGSASSPRTRAQRGLVPNLTTSGARRACAALLAIARPRSARSTSRSTASAPTYAAVRGFDGFARADARRAARCARVKRDVGINVRRHAPQLRRARPRCSPMPRTRRLARDRAACASSRRDAAPKAYEPTCAAPTRSTARSCRPCSPPRAATACASGRLLVHADGRAPPAGPALLAELAVYGCAGGDFLVGAKRRRRG